MTAPINKHTQSHLIEMTKENLLLERITLNGIDVNMKDEYGNNALYWAIKVGSVHNSNLLMQFGSALMVNNTKHALFYAIECKQHAIVVLLIEKGLDINMTDNKGKTLLMYAIESKVFETVRYLIRKGADLYLLDDALNLAEDYAKVSNSEEILSYMKHVIHVDSHVSTCNTSLCKCG